MKGIRTQPSLSRDFFLLSAVIVLILLMVSLWVSFRAYEEHAQKITTQLSNESTRIDRSLIIEIQNASFVLESLGRQISQVGVQDVVSTARLLRSFDDSSRKADMLLWIDNNQKIIITSRNGLLEKSIDVSDRDYVKKALSEPWKIQIGRPILGRVSEKWVLPIAMGMTDYTGKHVGIIMFSMDVNLFSKELKKDLSKQNIEFKILSKTLAPLTEDPEDARKNNTMPIDALTGVDFDVKPSGTISLPELLGKHKDYYNYKLSEHYPYVILIGYDGARVVSEITSLIIPRLLQVLAIGIFLLILLWMVRKHVISPVEKLNEITAKVVRGEPYSKLPSGAPLELEQLAEQISKLSDYMHERTCVEDEMRQKNKRLGKLKENMQLVSRARAKFLQSLAEELNKPVCAIQDAAEVIKEQHFGGQGNDTYLKYAFDIFRNSTQLQYMILDIMAVSELEQGVIILDDRPINLSYAVHRALRIFHDNPSNQHIEVKLRVDENLPALIVDQERFNQILLNLLSGAAQQLASGTPLLLECQIEAGDSNAPEYAIMLKYQLQDVDSYHPELEKSDFTKQFFTPENSQLLLRSEGISLALTRMLVSLHQGNMEIRVSSNQVARIYLRFPASRIAQK